MNSNKTTQFSFVVKRNWHLIDVKEQNFGRIATRVVELLMGKNKPEYSPQADCGDFVILVNTRFLKVSHPAKWDSKVYYHYSGYPGGIKETTLKEAVSADPREIMRKAIYRMLPKNKLRAQRINRLKLYEGEREGSELYASMRKKLSAKPKVTSKQ